MRSILLAAALVGLGACSTASPLKATMPMEVYRAEGQPPRLGEPHVSVGELPGDDLLFYAGFAREGGALGAPKWLTWRLPLGDYCRDRPTRVDALLIGPVGQVWHGRPIDVPAGPDRLRLSVDGFADKDNPDLMAALAGGGLFTLVLENNEGDRWSQTVVDTLTPTVRARLFAANLASLAKIKPNSVPIRSDMLRIEYAAPPSPPVPPVRPCSTT